MVHTVKVFGRKRKIVFLKPDDTILDGDCQILYGDGALELSEEEKKEVLLNKVVKETLCPGDKPSQHPQRIYFRFLN